MAASSSKAVAEEQVWLPARVYLTSHLQSSVEGDRAKFVSPFRMAHARSGRDPHFHGAFNMFQAYVVEFVSELREQVQMSVSTVRTKTCR